MKTPRILRIRAEVISTVTRVLHLYVADRVSILSTSQVPQALLNIEPEYPTSPGVGPEQIKKQKNMLGQYTGHLTQWV